MLNSTHAPRPYVTRLLAIAGLLGVAAVAILLRTRRAGDQSVLAILLPAVMIGELAGLSIARAYPFGGLLRHQYVVGPFLTRSSSITSSAMLHYIT